MMNLFKTFKNRKIFHISAFILCSFKLFSSSKSYSREKITENQENKDKPSFFEEANLSLLSEFKNFTVLTSNASKILMSKLRNKHITTSEFRWTSKRIIRLLLEEAIAGEFDQQIIAESPLGYYKSYENPRNSDNYIAVSIMRSGNIMIDDIIELIPGIPIGKILIQRKEDTVDKCAEYIFEKLPSSLNGKRVFLMDPMLATGGSVKEAIRVLLEKGIKEDDIIFVNLISCVEGIKNVLSTYPRIRIYSAQVDPMLLPNKYIAPGLGDFGDRYYATSI